MPENRLHRTYRGPLVHQSAAYRQITRYKSENEVVREQENNQQGKTSMKRAAQADGMIK
jgi:hypothetical protein